MCPKHGYGSAGKMQATIVPMARFAHGLSLFGSRLIPTAGRALNMAPFLLSRCLLLARGQRARAGKNLDQVDYFGVARGFPDELGQFLRHHRLDILADELQELTMQLGVFERFAHRVLENINTILRRSRRQYVRRADGSKNPPDMEKLFLPIRFDETLDLGKVAQARVLGAL